MNVDGSICLCLTPRVRIAVMFYNQVILLHLDEVLEDCFPFILVGSLSKIIDVV